MIFYPFHRQSNVVGVLWGYLEGKVSFGQNIALNPGCIPCKPHAGGTLVASQEYAKGEGWRTPDVQRSKEPCAEICFLLRPYAKDYSLGYIHADRKANSTPEIFGPKCMECTLALKREGELTFWPIRE